MASLEKQNGKRKTSSKDKKRPSLQKRDSEPGSSGSKLPKSCITMSKNKIGQNDLHLNVIPLSKKAEMSNSTAMVSNKSTCKRKKAFSKLRESYSLRSLGSGRVLRSRPNTAKCNTSLNPASIPENLVTRAKKRGKKKVKNSVLDELSRIKKHIRYMLNRMNYEQSLIDAYSGEGWKGRSAEKIRPEKELGRAKSEILRCKLKIREIFQHLDSLLAEGRLHESLFDPDGIDSENIFCGKCGSKQVFTDNDIILCDGACERGFHQKCLNPPLLSEDIPSGDEGWLCPQCDCKLECIDLLSEFLGEDLSIEDSWKKFFPEAAALANGSGQNDDLNLPSNDSEDDDYNSDTRGVDVDGQEEGPSYKASDSCSSLYDSTSSDDNVGQATAELSTDDSEDEDYDPDANKFSSDGSDFTSDSDEFCAELGKNTCANETSASFPPRLKLFIDPGRDNMKDQDEPLDYTKFPSPILELEKWENGLMLTNKRDRERLDYKKLYDEAYGKYSSDSSDDEDWNEMSTPNKLTKIDKSKQMSQKSISSKSVKAHVSQEHHSGSFYFGRLRRKSDVACKILCEAFQENPYPTKDKKESLAQELGMTYQQVTKWYSNARHNFRTASTENKAIDAIRSAAHESYLKKLNEAFQENQNPSMEKREELSQELGMTLEKVSRWFSNARHKFGTGSTQHKATNAMRSATHKPYKKKLNEIFLENQNPSKDKKEELSQELGITFEKKLNEVFLENQHPSKEKKQELSQELGITFEKVSRFFQTARRNSLASAMESGNPMNSSTDKAEASSSHKPDTSAADKTFGGKIDTPKSCASPGKPRKGIDTEPPEISATNGGCSSIEKGNKAVGSTTPKGGSLGFRDGIRKEDDQQKKAIARELKKIRTGR